MDNVYISINFGIHFVQIILCQYQVWPLAFHNTVFSKSTFISIIGGGNPHSAAIVVVTVPSGANSGVKCFQMVKVTVKSTTRTPLMCGRSGINV